MSRGGVQGFQSERLGQALAARGLRQAQLASMAGVSPATISKWRNGTQVPEAAALDRLASVLSVSSEWFTRPLSGGMSSPLFRSNASAHVAARAMLEARLAWAMELADGLGEFVDYPELNMPERPFGNLDEIASADIEEAADACRDQWGLGRSPIQDLALAAEGAGVVVIREVTGVAKIEGLSAWAEASKRPFVFLSADKENGYRSRFDLAHEIGHLVLHRRIQRTGDNVRHKLMEQQAHHFAVALLLPAEMVASQVNMPVTLDDLLLLKRRWGVSAAAIIMRLKAIELLDDDGVTALYKRRSARWGARSEPGDGDRDPEQPRLLRRTIELLVDKHVMPLDAIPKHIGLSATDIESLAGLPEGFFQGKASVVEFARLKRSGLSASPRHTESGNIVPFGRPNKR